MPNKRWEDMTPTEREAVITRMRLLGVAPFDIQQNYSLAGSIQKPEMAAAGALEAPEPSMQAGPQPSPGEVPIEEADVVAGGQAGATPSGGGGGWTNAATLALANSLPALISAAYQREGPPAGRSVGGGKPAFKMEDPFGKKERYRSLLAQYLRK